MLGYIFGMGTPDDGNFGDVAGIIAFSHERPILWEDSGVSPRSNRNA